MRSGSLKIFAVVLTVVMYAAGSPAQVESTVAGRPYPIRKAKPSARYSVSGTVVNSVTGEPVAHALVQVMTVVQHSAFTDGNGSFTIEGLPDGLRTTVQVTKPGFHPPGTDGTSLPMIAVGPDAPPVTIQLVPQSVIVGRVVDDEGEPLQGVMVYAQCTKILNGRKTWQACASKDTDEDGEFRLSGLTAGDYYLAASAMNHRLRGSDDEDSKTGYRPAHYPMSRDGASRPSFPLEPGVRKKVVLTMHRAPVFKVVGTAVGYGPNLQPSLELVSPDDSPVNVETQLEVQSGAFVMRNVPAGTYRLRAHSYGDGHQLTAEVPLNVSSDLENVVVAMRPLATIPVQVKTEFTRSDMPEPRGGGGAVEGRRRTVFEGGAGAITLGIPSLGGMSLEPTNRSGHSYYINQQMKDGRQVAQFVDVEPGAYTVNVVPFGSYYAAGVKYGGDDVLHGTMTVNAGSSSTPLEVTLRDDVATLVCTVQSGDGERPAWVLIAAANGSWVHAVNFATGRQMGVNVPPGEYKVYAFDRVDGFEYQNPDVLGTFDGQAVSLMVAPGEKHEVELQLIHR